MSEIKQYEYSAWVPKYGETETVLVDGAPGPRLIKSATRDKARYQFWCQVRDVVPLTLMDIRVRRWNESRREIES